MLFYSVIILFIFGVVIFVISNTLYTNTLFFEFICAVGRYMMIVFGISFMICIAILISSRLTEDADRLVNQQEYNRLLYKAENITLLSDQFSFNKQTVLNEITEWNCNYAKYQAYSKNDWIGIFYAKSKYDNTNYIDIDSIHIK